MREEISKHYDPKQVEDRVYSNWENSGYFKADPDPAKKPFTIVIPPPNVTDRLHMGHAFTNTIQDIFTRFYRMLGYNALWLPGTDHAGIATQNVVERSLRKEQGLSRHDLGREKFVEMVWQWREKQGDIILKQLRKLGFSCDWSRTKFTMDEDMSKAVIEAFVQLYEKGLIYRGKYIINWCPRCQTAISDEEVDHTDREGSLWYIHYPIVDSKDSIIVATTRPETMLGDTAVAVHPDDKRYKKFIGKTAILPILKRELPIVADEAVDRTLGTGAVKITPAHDPNDFELGHRHNLPSIIVIGPDGKMNEKAGPYDGMDRFEARKKLVISLKSQGLLEKIEKHVHSVGHCQRCNTVIEPYLSEQWFVKIKPLSDPALKAVQDGDIQMLPTRWVGVYENWMKNIRDWCISRQLWWGHRIPVYYCQDCNEMMVLREAPVICSKCGKNNINQDPDVLDTWFSSWLWPFSTMGWPEETEDQEYFYPTSTLVTGPDIIFFWVARMIMAGLQFKGAVPFKHIYFNGIVRDADGRKMSKSLGNGIDPLEMIEKFSADAVRYSIMSLSVEGHDINLTKGDFEIGRNFSNKIWNAFRFLWMNAEHVDLNLDFSKFCEGHSDKLELADRWILSRYAQTIPKITQALKNFRFSEYMDSMHAFFWGDFCDWYLELIKSRLYEKDNIANKQVPMQIAIHILKNSMKLMHPVIPFITEEIWQKLKSDTDEESIMISPWPEEVSEMVSLAKDREMVFIQDVISAVRNIRGEMNVPPGKKANAFIKTSNSEYQLLEANQNYLRELGCIENLKIGAEVEKPPQSASAVVRGIELYISLEGLIDIEKEKDRLLKEIVRIEDQIQKINIKLTNENFINRAPKDVIDKERNKKITFEGNLEKLQNNYSTLNE